VNLLLSDPAFLSVASGVGYDPDAAAYIARVEGASGDNQALEAAVKNAINDFVVGCKADGIWSAIKASCILAGARTLNGALQLLVGTAPNKFGTEGNWNYNRKTGLQGDGSTNYLNSNRNNNADPQDSKHLSVFISDSASFNNTAYIGARPTSFSNAGACMITRVTSTDGGSHHNSSVLRATASNATGFRGISRSASNNYDHRSAGVSAILASTSESPADRQIAVFALMQNNNSSIIAPTNARLAFYSIGESLDLALLDARVTALINAYAAAIP
jgi:hypothetical protein